MTVAHLHKIVNVASVPHRSPFRYPGGKTWLVPHARRWLASIQPRPLLLVEPFAGGAIVGLTAAFESLADKILLVELDPDVAAVWRAIFGGKAEALASRILSFKLTIETAKALLADKPKGVEAKAFATLLRNRVQHGGIMSPGASLMKEGENGKGIASRWYVNTLATRIRELGELRKNFEFIEGDAFKAIAAHRANKRAAFFIDPPYTIAGRRLYRHSDIDHAALFRLMATVKGSFLMTYDDTEEVRGWAKENCLEFETVAMKSRQHTRKTELLIGRNLDWARQLF